MYDFISTTQVPNRTLFVRFFCAVRVLKIQDFGTHGTASAAWLLRGGQFFGEVKAVGHIIVGVVKFVRSGTKCARIQR